MPERILTGKTLVKMVLDIDKGDKVKISKINFSGNEKLSDKKFEESNEKYQERKTLLRVLQAF